MTSRWVGHHQENKRKVTITRLRTVRTQEEDEEDFDRFCKSVRKYIEAWIGTALSTQKNTFETFHFKMMECKSVYAPGKSTFVFKYIGSLISLLLSYLQHSELPKISIPSLFCSSKRIQQALIPVVLLVQVGG